MSSEEITVLARPAFRNRADNPYNWLLYSRMGPLGCKVKEFGRMELLKKADILHVHWPEYFLRDRSLPRVLSKFVLNVIMYELARLKGMKVVWTVHNLRQHERYHPRIEKLFWAYFVRRINGYVCLTESARNAAIYAMPALENVPAFIIPHGHYRGVYKNEVSRQDARERLGIPVSSAVVLFFGQIRAYKNVLKLVEAFKGLGEAGAMLVVAGRPDTEAIERDLRDASRDGDNIHLFLKHIPDDDLQLYLNSADLVVLPFREILNSGSAILALSFNKPVLAPEEGSFKDLKLLAGNDWVRTYGHGLDVQALREALSWALDGKRQGRPDLGGLEWDAIARETAGAYEALLNG